MLNVNSKELNRRILIKQQHIKLLKQEIIELECKKNQAGKSYKDEDEKKAQEK
jgi:hypothetical protein